MTPSQPPGTPNDFESQLTAFLLGELDPTDAARVQAELDSNPELRRLKAELEFTLGLVREVLRSPAESDADSLTTERPRLSDSRREALLQSLRQAPVLELPKPQRESRRWMIPMAVAASLMGLLSLHEFGIDPREFSDRRAMGETAIGNERFFNYQAAFTSSTNESVQERRNGESKAIARPSIELQKQVQDAPVRQLRRLAEDTLSQVNAAAEVPPPANQFSELSTRLSTAEARDHYNNSLGVDNNGRFGRNESRAQNNTPSTASVPPQEPPKEVVNADVFDDLSLAITSNTRSTVGQLSGQVPRNYYVPQFDAADSKANGLTVARFAKDKVSNAPTQAGAPAAPEPIALAPTLGTVFDPTKSAKVYDPGIIAPTATESLAGRRYGLSRPLSAKNLALGESEALAKPALKEHLLGETPMAANTDAPGVLILSASDVAPDAAAFGRGTKLQADLGTTRSRGGLADVKQELYTFSVSDGALEPQKEETLQRTPAADSPLDLSLARQAPAPAPIPQPEKATTEDAFSTFSLNVTDVSFKLAAASLQNGVMPAPATIRSEEFINAFKYRDPEPASGSPMSFAWDRAASPFAQNRELLRFAVKTAASGREADRPLNLVLLLDKSGSMERRDRVETVREALTVLGQQLTAKDRLSVVTFARTPHLILEAMNGSSEQMKEFPKQVASIPAEGGTNLEEAMKLAYATASKHFVQNGVNRVVLLTDGAANLGDVEPSSLQTLVESWRQRGIALDSFGIGWEGLNDPLLSTLSNHGDGRYAFVNSVEEAHSNFASQLAGALQVAASDVKVQVEFNPQRVANWRQIGYATHQLTKEQFRDNQVDAAELAAAEAGNALYTIQALPQGSGPIATVRARFRDPVSNQYREQGWTVPYNGAAQGLENAAPRMRLASVAGLFSEWLAQNPYAAEVKPNQLLGFLAGVPEAFAPDPLPNQLQSLIQQAQSLSGK